MRTPTTMNWKKSCELMESKRRVFMARMNRMCSCVEYDAPHLLPAAAFGALLSCRGQAPSGFVLRRTAGFSISSKHTQRSLIVQQCCLQSSLNSVQLQRRLHAAQ